jgi:signal transduction histidine kinase
MNGVRSVWARSSHPTGTGKRFPISVAVLAASLLGLQLLRPVYAEDPGVRAGLEAATTLSALLSAYLLLVVFDYGRRLCDLLLLVALLTLSLVDFAFVALPALTGAETVSSGAGARLGSEVVVSIAFAAAAFAPTKTLVGHGRRPVVVALLAAVGMVSLTALVGLIGGAHWAPSALSMTSGAGAADHPLALTVHVISSGVLLLSGIAFVVRAGPRDRDAGLLAGASFLLAAARLAYLAVPAAAADWVTPAVGMRVAAYGLLLAVAFRHDAKSRQEMKWAAVSAERQRIARDLHDGLAQDLAVIAAHGQQLASEFGPDHPLVIAARRTLAASRGTIVDLSASGAPTTGAALRQVADELEDRFGVRVNVQIKPDSRKGVGSDLDRPAREEVVRIAREAIVNAIRHGGAKRIDVELDIRGPELLRVADDGCGIGAKPIRSRGGLGLPTMRARAESIGGSLSARRRADGGTELEVRVL